MDKPDLNLLVALNVLLDEGNVAGAARRLQLSPSAMSRTLARLRETTGDPLLVRAGRGLVPTPRAVQLGERVGLLVQDAEAMLGASGQIDLTRLERTFSLRTTDGFVENFGAALIARVLGDAPGVKLRFLPKADKDSAPLRQGSVDLETGVISEHMGPEIRTQGLFRDRYVGVVRRGHPLAKGRMTAKRYSAGTHVLFARDSSDGSVIDAALTTAGLARRVVAIVGGFSAAIALARRTDLVASVPKRHSGNLRDGMHTFTIPLALQEFTVSMLWHPRLDADPAHRWLRKCVLEVCSSRGMP